MPIPWTQVLMHGPKVLDVASSLVDQWKSRPRPSVVDPGAEVQTQVHAIVQRLQAVEEAETAQAEVIKSMAEQIQGVSAGLSELSGKITMAIWLASSALIIGIVALVVSLVR